MLNKLEHMTQHKMGYQEPVTALFATAVTGGATYATGAAAFAAGAAPAAATFGAASGLSLGAIAAGVSAVAGIGGVYQSKQAAKAAKSRARAERRIADYRNRQERLQALRRARITREDLIAGGEQAGASGSSAVQGGAAGVGSQLRANLSFLDQTGAAQAEAAYYGQKSADYQSSASIFGAVSELSGRFADYKSIFKDKKA